MCVQHTNVHVRCVHVLYVCSTAFYIIPCLPLPHSPSLSLSLSLLSFLLSSFYSQSYEGHFMLRRKSGSCIKQHIKLMPVRDSSGFVSHHVTIRRQLSSQEIRATMFNSGEGGRERGREGGREKYIYSTVHLQIEYF